MRIVPVIDLQHGRVVRGVAGDRESYQPVRSCLSATAAPRDVAHAFVHKLGRNEVYVADLDAIGGRGVSWESLAAIAGTGLRLWVDAGIRTADDALRVASFSLDAAGTRVDRVIVGLESVVGPSAVAEILQGLGPQRVIFSLDLRAGKLVAGSSAWKHEQPIEIVRQMGELGVRQFIVLDVAHVGTGQGVPTGPLCREMTERFRDFEVITGGGVSVPEDLADLAAFGITAALVASALHDGRLGKKDIDAIERR